LGIICGGIKSRFFTEYLAGKAGVTRESIRMPEYRVKDVASSAGDYSFACVDKNNNINTVKMRSVGDMWGTGLFKANACDFCDDVTTELADISLGDAWLQPYNSDGRGTNVIVTRSSLADNLIQEGLKEGKLIIETLHLDLFLESQRGSFNHRHTGLPYRIKLANRRNIIIPPKRFDIGKVSFDFKIVQKARRTIRQKSLEIWISSPIVKAFDMIMNRSLKKLRIATHIYHYCNAFRGRVIQFGKK